MLELLTALFIIFLIVIYGFYLTNKRDKLMQEGHPELLQTLEAPGLL